MAYDKVVDSVVLDAVFAEIADAIRAKTGGDAVYIPGDMAEAILAIAAGIDTSDATATAGDIASGKTAYVNGNKITGNVTVDSGTSYWAIRSYEVGSNAFFVKTAAGSKAYLLRKGTVLALTGNNSIIDELYNSLHGTSAAAMLAAYEEGVNSV